MANALRDLVLPALDVEHAGEPWPLIRAGIIGSVLLVFSIAAWVWIAPLSGAVIGPGHVKVDMNRKTVQHQQPSLAHKAVLCQRLVLGKLVTLQLDRSLVGLQLDIARTDLVASLPRLIAEQRDLVRERFAPHAEHRTFVLKDLGDPRLRAALRQLRRENDLGGA